jgi:hypothetical protein
MFDHESITTVAELGEDRDHFAIIASKSDSGSVKEVAYCSVDHCFFVTIDGRERLRSDVPETAYRYFRGDDPG